MFNVVSAYGLAARVAKVLTCARSTDLVLACVLTGPILFATASTSGAAGSLTFGVDGALILEPQSSVRSKLGAFRPPPAAAPERKKRQRSKTVHLASLGPKPQPEAPTASVTGGGGIRWVANAGCLASSLRSVLAHLAANFGSVTVNSTCRSPRHNRRVGGARKSYHLTGNAADFRIRGNVRGAFAYLRSAVGGLKHYGGGRFHIDTGPRRRM